MKQIFTLLLAVWLTNGYGQVNFNLPANPPAAVIQSAEYFFDSDPGRGNGSAISITPATDLSASFTANIGALTPGVHRLYLRTRDAAGRWSLTAMQTIGIISNMGLPPNPVPASITAAEYFIDTDPGFGNGTSVPLTPATDVTVTYSPSISALSAGVHRIYFRVRDAAGKWSLAAVRAFALISTANIPANPAPAAIVQAEYFIDTDPGRGAATPITIAAGTDISASNIALSLSGLTAGVHRIYFRVRDAHGNWSHTANQVASIVVANTALPSNPAPGNIISLEYFFDTDPGFGMAHAVTLPASTDISQFSFMADISALPPGAHTLYIRTLDDWSLTNTVSFAINSVLPVTWLSFSAQQAGDSVLLHWKTAAELGNQRFDAERSADGQNFHSIGHVPGAGSSNTVQEYAFTDRQPLSGVSYYRIRQTDADGRWSYSAVIPVRIFSGHFAVVTNPVRQTLRVQLAELPSAHAGFRIYTGSGEQVMSRTVQSGQMIQQLDVSALAAGAYLLVYDHDGVQLTARFIKL